LEPTKKGPQGMGSAITYARRYALGPILGLATEQDDDANSASPKPGEASGGTQPQADNRPWLKEDQFTATLNALLEG
ncbi:MAG: ERF family protein, partial [Bacteroidota bacterium]